ncbi:MAG: hypothetical protein KBS70_04355 [Bacteroidales bacterium]|nr:hypothetical protein [Candidatus Colicola equi]
MKNKFKFLATMLIGILLSTNVWGTEVTFIFNTDAGLEALGITKPNNGEGTALTENQNYTISPISFSTTHGSTNTRVWNTSGTTSLRVYKNTKDKTNYGTLTFTSSAGNITAIALGAGTWTASVGTMNNTNWSGNASSVTFTCTANATISTMTVTYTADPSCTTDLAKPIVTATAGNGSATLTWGAVEHATKYQVSWNNGVYTDATSPYEKSGLTNDVTYTWKVKAIGGDIYCDSEEATGNVTPSANHTVTWYVDGEVYTEGSPTTEVADGGKVTELPTQPGVPDACTGSVFVGWTDQAIYIGTGTKPDVLFKDAADAPKVNEDVTYHAVFADPE